MLKEGSSIMV